MLRQSISEAPSPRVPPRVQRRSDHTMEMFQYGIAFLAIAVAVLLAAVR
jgi:hypothetical protein